MSEWQDCNSSHLAGVRVKVGVRCGVEAQVRWTLIAVLAGIPHVVKSGFSASHTLA